MSHPYQCYREILTQRKAWEEAVDVVLAQEKEIRTFFQSTHPDQIIFAGCTSPYYAGKAAADYWQSITGLPARAVPCSELIQFPETYYSAKLGKPVLMVLSRSGKTSETIWAVEEFEKRFPGRIVYIGNAPGSVLASKANLKILIPKGAEESMPQTRSFSVMYLAALMVGALLANQSDTLEILKASPTVVDPVIQSIEPIVKNIFENKRFQNIFCLGSGPLHGIALEATLKMIEMSISNVLCFPVLESRHGPKSLIDENSMVVALYSQGGLNYEADLMSELTRVHRATTVAIIPDASWNTGEVTYKLPVNCAWPDGILGLSYLPVIQLLAYYLACSKGVDPDSPRNLTAYIEIGMPK
jgi:glutamine---fructose-6-phosphate transaminase (isomerizing)